MSDSEDDFFAPSAPPPPKPMSESDDDFAPSAPKEAPKPKLRGEEKKAQETKEFDESCEQGMAHVHEEEWKDATLCFEKALKLDAKTEGSKDVSEERADCAFNLACCHAQCGKMDDAETWLQRAVAWGVRGVDLLRDEHLAPLRAHDIALCMNLNDALQPAPVRQAAVLQRSRRKNTGGAMAKLIRQEKERQDMHEDEDIDDFWKDDKDDDAYSGSADSDHERRDVFDSDFDEDVSESEEEGWGFDDDQKEAKARQQRIDERKKAREVQRKEEAKKAPVTEKRKRRAAAENSEARTRVELEGNTTKDDNDDVDFKDAKADQELAAGHLQARQRAAPSYRDAVSAAKRGKLVAKAAQDLGLESDSDAEMAPVQKKKKKKQKKAKKTYVEVTTGPPAQLISVLCMERKTKRKKKNVLQSIFGRKGSAQICRRADRAVEERKALPPPKSSQEILKNLVRKQKVIEERRFGGETVQVVKTKMESGSASAQRRKAHDRLDHVLDLIAGKKEITATEKSAQEWDQFKEKNKLQDSLKGGTGMLDKNEFLERTDHRRFAIERDQRNAERAKRDADGK